MDRLLTIINNEKKTGYILGDFNINILKSDVHVDTCSFTDCLFSNLFLPTVTCPTRITETSATLIDNIITNASLINPLSYILYSDISDHLSVYLSTDLDSPKARRSCYYYNKRNFGEANLQRFISNIQQTDWDIDNCDFTAFSETFTSIFDNCFPLEKYSLRKNTTLRKPWMTKGPARSSAEKKTMYKTYIKNPSDANTRKHLLSTNITHSHGSARVL